MVNATKTVYDLTNSSDAGTVLGFVSTVNDMTGQVFMLGVLLVSFVIFFVGFSRYGNSEAFLAAGFISTIMTILFATLNLVPSWVTILVVIFYGIFWTYRMIIR